MNRIQLPKHEEEFNTLHTKIALNKILTFQNELLTTRNELFTTQKEHATTQNELSTARNDLSTTREELSTTRKELVTTRNDLRQTINRLDRFEENQKAVVAVSTKQNYSEQLPQTTLQRPPQQILTQPTTTLRPSSQCKPQRAETDNPLILMTQILHPSQPNTTQQTYTTKLQRLFNSIAIGEIHHINDNECFSKIHFPQTHQM